LLVSPSDPVSLAEAAAALLKDPQKAISLGEKGRQKVEKEFTIEKHTSILSKLYEKLLGHS
jgi:glycosyltransferase involved in cell wall biosynthesis